ncbi:uncharacterized protein PFL1_00918 [Pseudozyma flocculosa PF-1]|uniref:uncharacterized protein n=1 Tax=Pseudozyma flocculosa PF-1 TaxID=1277687 RepID=UPI00045605D6|nr:uncharacterized protein PFL1_00918 [Pseudozyma flocculosa PF-1]EPQ31585.1 hypothetical protein PFL1_00918 [Pseudozyma flocculosa PF-1]
MRSLTGMLGPSVCASTTIAQPSDLTLAYVRSKLGLGDGSGLLQSPAVVASPRFSDYGTSRREDQLRALLADPTLAAPKRAVSEIGTGASASSGARPDWSSLKQEPRPNSARELRILAWRTASGLAAPISLDEDDAAGSRPTSGRPSIGTDSEGSSTIRPSESGSVLGFRAGGQRIESPVAFRLSESDESRRLAQERNRSIEFRREELARQEALHRDRLNAERARVRADEAIRDEVMRKLRAEQAASGPSSPRPRSKPPAVPPPAFAPPPPPTSPAPRKALPQRPPDSRVLKSPTILVEKPMPDVPYSPESNNDSDCRSAQGRERQLSHEHDSVISYRTADLWRVANENHPVGPLPDTPISVRTSRKNSAPRSPILSDRSNVMQTAADLSPKMVGFRKLARSLETEGLEGRTWIAKHSREATELTRSASHYSSDAPSLFDKELPPPPPESEATTDLSSPVDDVGGFAGGSSEMDNLKAKALEARQRALTAERAALIEIEKARQQQSRLEWELQEAQKRNQDLAEQEGLRRAKWAREQAERDRLDAFERSQLEAAERRRRQKEELARQVALRQADEARREKQRLDKEQEEARIEAERRRAQAAEREARIAAEMEAQAKRKTELAAKQRRQLAEREMLTLKLETLARYDKVLLEGVVAVQNEKSLVWRRRYFILQCGGLDLYKSKEDASLSEPITTIPLRGRLKAVSDAFEECQMQHSLKVEIAAEVAAVDEGEGCATAPADAGRAAEDGETWFLSFETDEQKLSLHSGIHVVARSRPRRSTGAS